MNFKPQVPRSHYFSLDYDTKYRWISYWHQISEVLKTKPKKVLEVGVGNKTVYNYLKKFGINTIAADIDPKLRPDRVCSVTELTKYFRRNEFDTVLCSEVLEHIPFKYFEKSLEELSNVAKSYVILSLPHFGIHLNLSLNFFPKTKRANLLITIPFPIKHKFDWEHYWEIGKRGYSLSLVKEIISKYFTIKRTYLIPENPYHRFFILKVRK